MRFQFTIRDWFVVLVIVGALYWGLFEGKTHSGGSGYPPLRLDFSVVDDASGQPIPGASIEVLIPENSQTQHIPSGIATQTAEGSQYDFVANQEGKVSEQLKRVFCDFNEVHRGGRLVKRFHYYGLPPWKFRVTSDGYETSKWEVLYEDDRCFKPVFVPNGKAYLPITIRLKATNSPATATSE